MCFFLFHCAGVWRKPAYGPSIRKKPGDRPGRLLSHFTRNKFCRHVNVPFFATILALLLVLAVLVVPTLSSQTLGSFVTSSGTLSSQTLGSLVLVAVLLGTHFAIFPELRETLQVMSLSEIALGGAAADAVGATISTIKCPLVLKTSDQYDLWRARVGDVLGLYYA